MAKLISKTYGDALFNLAIEEGKVDSLTEEVKAVEAALKMNEELGKFISHPEIPKQDKVKVIENIFKQECSDDMVGFLVLIVEKGRFGKIIEIFDYYMNRYREYKKIGVAYVTTAIELTDSQKIKIEEKLLATTKYTSFEMNYNVDNSIIGGIIIRIGDRVVDNSVKSQIQSMTKALA